MNYVVIIPAKNEEGIIGSTLDLLVKQTFKPSCILVVDNGSSDKTQEIIKSYERNYPFIRYLNFSGDISYSLGGKIVRIFSAGKDFLDSLNINYDYIVKMDADISFENNIFERISNKLGEKGYGIVSPLPFIMENGKRIFTSTPDWHTTGDFKIYNKSCLEEMGGLKEDLGWDCADNISAMEKGYETKVFRDINYKQIRPIGRYSVLKGSKRQGMGAYKLRYGLPYVFLKFIHDLIKPPVIIGSIYYLNGFIYAVFKSRKRILTRKESQILRSLQWKDLLFRIRNKRFYLFQVFKKNQSG